MLDAYFIRRREDLPEKLRTGIPDVFAFHGTDQIEPGAPPLPEWFLEEWGDPGRDIEIKWGGHAINVSIVL